ncbi:MAG TPA: HAMP domain-containing sensor histidine kinase [Kofleriaceae bacterium]|nr:HAMP domain-containing sensor histidine kinase [Kofleriaceae bacterium]
MKLAEFLTSHRAEIIERCRAKVRSRLAPRATEHELASGIPIFIDQVTETLQAELQRNPDSAHAATGHGHDLMAQGFTVAQVVHDYGDICQAVTDAAIERGAPISNEDFRLLNRCLDDAIADAVTEFTRMREIGIASEGTQRLGMLAHEVRNLLASATLTFDVIKEGKVGITSATAAVLDRSLTRLASLVDRSLAEVRLEVGQLRRERILIGSLLEEVEIDATLIAKARGIMFSLTRPDDPSVSVQADPQILSAIVVNLVQNAIKFTRPHGHVTLSTRADAERVHIEVADECGGLGEGTAETLFRAFEQKSADRSGVGLGLLIARRGAEAHGGQVSVRDLPGTGCVFTLELPRAT